MAAELVLLRVGAKFFHAARARRLGQVFDAYYEATCTPYGTRVFSLRGAALSPEQTPRDLQMSDNDVIDVAVKGTLAILVSDWRAEGPLVDRRLTVDVAAPLLPALRAHCEDRGLLDVAGLRFEAAKGLVEPHHTAASLEIEEEDNVAILRGDTARTILIGASLDLQRRFRRIVDVDVSPGKVLDAFCAQVGIDCRFVRVDGVNEVVLEGPIGRGPPEEHYMPTMRDMRAARFGPSDGRPAALDCVDTRVLQRHLDRWQRALEKGMRRRRRIELRAQRLRDELAGAVGAAGARALEARIEAAEQALEDLDEEEAAEEEPCWYRFMQYFATRAELDRVRERARQAVYGAEE